jgi:hypothetical protein
MTLTLLRNRLIRSSGVPPYAYKLGPEGSGQIDLSAKAVVFYGIYHLDGDTLTLCVDPAQLASAYDPKATSDEKTRPAKFDPEAGTVIVLKRNK